ncbi:PREDICTED: histamine H2 receptor isoform X2 [Condylura cristata]|uniref:histamine H2 receptor isoform X2 n=1 Tax=Condylura cristata TaxID=143302 RepID=UPI000643AD6E|nr:PREDICTED: histamine H2 receptor isoform X2 [Condylura cristata]
MAANVTDSSCLDSITLKITVSVVLTVLILITIAGNVVVCLAVGLNRRLRSLTNCFIVSLAVTDLLLGLLVLPFSAFYQLSCRWSFGKVFCDIYTSLDVMLCTASILNLFMISLDRYCAVTDPLRYPVLITPLRVAVSLVLIWVISITLSFLSIHLGWNSRNETSMVTHTVPKCKVQVNLVYGLVDGLVTFYLPLLVMCITYYRIFKIARDQAKRIHHVSSWKAATVREHKATVTLAAVMGAFIVCWFPYFTVFVYRGLRGDDAINEVFEAIVLWLGYANSALNPILYAALNRDFRTAYQQLFRCRPAGHTAHEMSLRSNSSQLSRNQSREPRQQEEKPLKLQRVWGVRPFYPWRGSQGKENRGRGSGKPFTASKVKENKCGPPRSRLKGSQHCLAPCAPATF